MRDFNIYVTTIQGKKVLSCNNIMYAESQNSLSRIVFSDNTTEEVLLTISELEYLLRKRGFFRFNHRSLVNLRFVQVIFPLDASKVILENGKEIFVSQDKKDDLFESLKKVFDLQEVV